MAAVDILRDALFGNPPSPTLQPSREGVLAAFAQLQDQATTAIAAAVAGVTTVATINDRNTFYANADNRGKLVYVNNNNGSATDSANGVYEYANGAPRLSQSFYAGVATIVQPLVTQAQGYRDQVQAAIATITPQAPATTTSNTSSGTVYTLNGGSTPFVDGVQYDWLVPATNLGPVSIKIGSNTLVLYDANQGTLAANALPAGSLVRIKLNLSGSRFNLVNMLSTVDAVRGVATDATGARSTLEGIYGLPIALPYQGNVNFLITGGNVPAPADQSTFEVIVSATNTGAARLFIGGVNLPIKRPGTAADMVAGDLPAGYVINLTRSDAGQQFSFNGARPLTMASPPVGSQDSDLAYNPWGTVTNSGSGSSVAAITKNLVVIGSSNAASDYVPSGSRPDQLAVTALNDLFAGEGITFAADLRAVQGAPWSAASGQLQASSVFMNGTAKWVLPFFWMNDCRSIFYHDNGGVRSQFNALIGIIDYVRSKGAEPVLVTGFHPDARANPGASGTKALDPFYFSDTSTYPNGGSGRSMVYPVFKASPVSPTADMVPAATVADFMVSRDWTGGGVARTGYKRVWHFNRTVREIAAAKKCILLDIEWSTFRTCIEPIADLGSGLDTYYDVTNPLHPKAPLYQTAIKPVIQQWARAMADGRDDIRVFRGV